METNDTISRMKQRDPTQCIPDFFKQMEGKDLDDSERLQFAADADRLLTEFDLSGHLGWLLALHACAASLLIDMQGGRTSNELTRILVHLDDATTALPVDYPPETAQAISGLRASAYMRAADHLRPDQLTDATQACLDAMATPKVQSSAAHLGPMSFNAARFMIQRGVLPDDAATLSRLDELFSTAHRCYRLSGLTTQAAEAATYLVRIAIQRLRACMGSPDEMRQWFDGAERKMNEALMIHSEARDAAAWGSLNLLAGELMALRPDAENFARVNGVVRCLNRALSAFKTIGDQGQTALVAAQILNEMVSIPAPWPEKLANRYMAYLDDFESARDFAADPHLRANVQLKRANALMKTESTVSPDGLHSLLERVRLLAEEAAALAATAEDHTIGANAFKLVGSTLIGTDEDDGDAAEGPAGDDLVRACAAFETALAHARAASETSETSEASPVPPVLRLLGIALARRVTRRGEMDLAERCLDVLGQAIDVSEGEERLTANVNLASIAAMLAQPGRPWPRGRAHKAIDEALGAVSEATRTALGQHVESVYWRLQALDCVTSEGPAPPTEDPERIGCAVYRGRLPRQSESASELVVTLLLHQNIDAQARQWLTVLPKEDGSTFATIDLRCSRCEAALSPVVPIAIDSAVPTPSIRSFERMARGEERCPGCATVYKVQLAFTARVGACSDRPGRVCPNALTAAGDLQQGQFQVAETLWQRFSGRPYEAEMSIPWSGYWGLKRGIHVDQFVDLQRQMAITRLIQGLFGSQHELILEGLRTYLRVPARPTEVTEDDVKASLAELRDLPSHVLGATASTISTLLAEARVHGPETVVDRLIAQRQRSMAKARPLEEALSLAGDASRRREFLTRFATETPDYSPERGNALHERFLLEAERDWRQMEAEGVATTEPLVFEGARQVLLGLRQWVEEEIAKDRIINSSATAKAILSARMSDEARFVLVLRAFSLDATTAETSSFYLGLMGVTQDPRMGYRTTCTHPSDVHVVDQIYHALPRDLNVVTAFNVTDLNPPAGPAKLFVTEQNWQLPVFCLIAEAAAIILIVPRGSHLATEGLAHEIHAIRELSRVNETIAVLATPKIGHADIFEVLEELIHPPSEFDKVHDTTEMDLRAMGFGQIVDLSDIEDDAAQFAGAIQTLWSSGGQPKTVS